MAATQDFLNIVSINVEQGIGKKEKLSNLIGNLRQIKADVALLQETNILQRKFKEIIKQQGYQLIENQGTTKSIGVTTLIKKDLEIINEETYTLENKGQIIVTKIHKGTETYTIINTYYPEENRPFEQKHITNKIKEFMDKHKGPYIWGGDFNSIEQKSDSSNKIRKTTKQFTEIKTIHNMYDPWTELNTDNKGYTRRMKKGGGARIDRFYISRDIEKNITQLKLHPNSFSDHDGIHIQISTGKNNLGQGTWKLNTNILKNKQYREEIERFWTTWKTYKISYESQARWWDEGKSQIKRISRNFSKNKKKERNEEEKKLRRTLYDEIERHDNGENRYGKIKEIKDKLNEINKIRHQGNRVRSREQEYREDEKCTSFFYQKEKKNGINKHIASIKKEDGTETTEMSEIKTEIEKFYTTLYTSQNSLCPEGLGKGIREQTNRNNIKVKAIKDITKEEQNKLGGWITKNEIWKALASMRNNKSPGIDGLPREFYKTFWNIIGDDLCETLNNIYLSGNLSNTMELAILSLLFKKGIRSLLKNWRPISLLTTDYKILSKILATRLRDILDKIIHSSQACGVKGRKINHHIWLLDHLINYQTTHPEIEFATITLDQEKAFDRIEHDYLIQTLESYDLGEKFIKWVKILYKKPVCKVNVNGHITNKIKITRGIRQGCPLSMLLFTLAINPLLEEIDKEKDIKGPTLPNNKEIKLLAYADDVTIILTKEHEIETVYKIYEMYGKKSGAKLNKEKTEICIFGEKLRRKFTRKYQHLITNTIKILGITFGYKKEYTKINIENKMEKIAAKLETWKTRNLTLYGKTELLNSTALSQIWYVAQNLDIKKEYIDKIEKEIFKFLWHPLQYEPIRRQTIYLERKNGGLGLQNIYKRTQAFKYAKYVDLFKEVKPWHTIIAYNMGQRLKEHVPGLDTLTSRHKEVLEQKTKIEIEKILTLKIEAKDTVKSIELKIGQLEKIKEIPRIERIYVNINYKHIWHTIATLKIKNKIRQHMYRTFHNTLATQALLEDKWKVGSKIKPCILCNKYKESSKHLFEICSFSMSILEILYIKTPTIGSYNNYRQHIWLQSGNDITDMIISIWYYTIWKERNNRIYRGIYRNQLEIIKTIDNNISKHLKNYRY